MNGKQAGTTRGDAAPDMVGTGEPLLSVDVDSLAKKSGQSRQER